MLITASNKSNAKRALKKYGELALANAETLICKLDDGRFGFNEFAAIEYRDQPVIDLTEQKCSPFGALFGATAPVSQSKPSIVVRDGRKINVSKESNRDELNSQATRTTGTMEERFTRISKGCCPECGADSNSQSWSNEGISMACGLCSSIYSLKTSRLVRTGQKRPSSPSGYNIDKVRQVRNGITRRSSQTNSGKLWDRFDAVLAEKGDVKKDDIQIIADDFGWKVPSVLGVFYLWKKFVA